MRCLRKNKFIFLFFGVLALMLCLPQMVHAHTRPELDSQGTVTISYELAGATFRLYKVADMSEKATFSLSGEFAGYQVSLDDLDSDGWRAAAQTLAAYAERDSRAVRTEGMTDTDGKLQFSGLAMGLYLVTGDSLEKENVRYEPVATLISLPNLNEDDTWNYTPVLFMKYEKQEQKQETVACKVTKRWEDAGHKDSRPASVTAQLLRDGKVYDEVKLKKENQWTHTWKDLEQGHKWTVAEKKTDKSYTVKVQKNGTDFVITNTYKENQPQKPTVNPPEKPGETPVNPGTPQTGDWTSVDVTGGGSGGPDSSGVKLPQTGQLWWPVPYLALAGVVLVCLGMFRRKRES